MLDNPAPAGMVQNYDPMKVPYEKTGFSFMTNAKTETVEALLNL
jgi:hypothetical protein